LTPGSKLNETLRLRRLHGTSLDVSRLCLGTMTFGKPVDQTTACSMVDRCIDAGINFFDTANVYQAGAAETMLGNAICGKRSRLVVASKVRGKMDADECGLSQRAVRRALESSLRRLQTDYLDIYYLHQPDYETPIEETLLVMDQLVREGKVRNVATSNYSSWQVCEMLCVADKSRYQPARIAQQMYNLLARGIEQEFLPMASRFEVSTVAYNPLAGGLLTGKHRFASAIPGTRFDDNRMYQDRYWHEPNFVAVNQLADVARQVGRSLTSLALNWLIHHTEIDAAILGASSIDQLEENLKACEDGPIPPEALQACDQIWRQLRGPTPIYNR